MAWIIEMLINGHKLTLEDNGVFIIKSNIKH